MLSGALFQFPNDQQSLTTEKHMQVDRFAADRIHTQLSTEPVDEQEAEALLRQAYKDVGLTAPQHIYWVDGPLQLGATLAADIIKADVEDSAGLNLRRRAEASIWRQVVAHVEPGDLSRLDAGIGRHVATFVWDRVGNSIQDATQASIGPHARASVAAYEEASWLALYHFYAIHLAPNGLYTLACFNELVSGYRLGRMNTVIVRRPKVLSCDDDGQLHSATGQCVSYHDGWGFCAWHGVRVPDKVILSPEQLTRDDFLNEPNLEVRRIIQERMGSRFVPELGGRVIESGPRGTLYEVRLPGDDPERVAHYVQVQDASTPRQYFLRVPPRIQTAAEAVAWSFNLSVEEYQPIQET